MSSEGIERATGLRLYDVAECRPDDRHVMTTSWYFDPETSSVASVEVCRLESDGSAVTLSVEPRDGLPRAGSDAGTVLRFHGNAAMAVGPDELARLTGLRWVGSATYDRSPASIHETSFVGTNGVVARLMVYAVMGSSLPQFCTVGV
jgi:hypothetical protein